jgi:hypothetical protein
MSALTPAANPTITLPPGVSVLPGRQTSQTNGSGQVQQGTAFTVNLPDGTTTNVFVPDSMLSNLPAVEALITNKVTALMAITGATA